MLKRTRFCALILPTPAPDPLAGVTVQILDQQQVEVGDHTLTLNRIASPVFRVAVLAAPAPTPVPSLPTTAPEVSKPSVK